MSSELVEFDYLSLRRKGNRAPSSGAISPRLHQPSMASDRRDQARGSSAPSL